MSRTESSRPQFCDTRGGMIGRVYTWNGGFWRVLTRWGKGGVRNVLIERVEPCSEPENGPAALYLDGALRKTQDGLWWRSTGERVVRPFRGLRRRAA